MGARYGTRSPLGVVDVVPSRREHFFRRRTGEGHVPILVLDCYLGIVRLYWHVEPGDRRETSGGIRAVSSARRQAAVHLPDLVQTRSEGHARQRWRWRRHEPGWLRRS